VAEVTVATAFALPPSAEPIAAPRRAGPLKPFVRMEWCMPCASQLATSSRVVAGPSTLRACAENVPVVGNIAVCSPIVAKRQQPFSPSIQSTTFRTPASSWRACDATEPTCAHIVKPSTGVASSSGSSSSSSSSRAAVMSHDVFRSAQKPQMVRRPLSPSRIRRYSKKRAVEDASAVRGSPARGSDTASSGGVVGAIPPPEKRWRSTVLISEPIAVPRVPAVAVEPIGQKSCGCATIPLRH